MNHGKTSHLADWVLRVKVGLEKVTQALPDNKTILEGYTQEYGDII